jgi:type IV fimbrial biogenesis protein FimT
MEPAGVTLIELLVILSILAILTGLSATALFSWLPRANLSRASRTIVSMAQDAKVEAIKRNEQMQFNCNSTANVCEVRISGSGSVLKRFDLGTLGSRIVLTSSLNTNFNSRGRATSAGTISMQNNAGDTRSVVVRTSGSVITQ